MVWEQKCSLIISKIEKLEKDKNEKKELERCTHVRKFLEKTTAAKYIKDEDVLERNGFTIT
jgi:hypothetical protein